MRYIYLVKAGNDQYKIGVSRNVEKRISALQTSNINRVELVCAKRSIIDTAVEKKLHRMLREFGGTGGKEWFHLTPQQAIEVAIELNKAPDVDIAETVIQDLKKQVSNILEVYQVKIEQEAKKNSQSDEQSKPKKMKLSIDREALRREAEEAEYEIARELIINSQRPSTSFIQRRMSIGYGKAARIMDRLEKEGVISPLDGIHRKVL